MRCILNTEAQPPHSQFGEAEQSVGAGKWRAIVGSNGPRQTEFFENTFKYGEGEVRAC